MVLEVSYQLNTHEIADMVLKGSEDWVNYHQTLIIETEEGRGSLLLKFTAELVCNRLN